MSAQPKWGPFPLIRRCKSCRGMGAQGGTECSECKGVGLVDDAFRPTRNPRPRKAKKADPIQRLADFFFLEWPEEGQRGDDAGHDPVEHAIDVMRRLKSPPPKRRR